MKPRSLCKYVISNAVVDDYRFLAIVLKQELTRWRISISGEPSNEELSWIASTYSRPLDEKEREIDRQMVRKWTWGERHREAMRSAVLAVKGYIKVIILNI